MARSAGRSIRTFALLTLMTAFASGCETMQQTDETLIGTLRISGDAVFLNGRKSTDGARVHVNDTVTTGVASSAMVEYVGGGFIQLDQNTDPVFSFRIVAGNNRRCIHVLIQFGQVFIDKDLQCFDTPNAAGALGSRVNIKVTRARESVITVMSGKVSMTRPRAYPVYASQQTVLSGAGRTPQVRTLPQSELERTVKWREKYSFTDQSDEDFGPMLIHRPIFRPGPRRMPAPMPKPTPAPTPRDYSAPR